MPSIQSTSSKFADKDRFPGIEHPVHTVTFFRIAVIPTHIFIKADNVKEFSQRVIHSHNARTNFFLLHRRTNQADIIQTPDLVCQLGKECQARFTKRRFIGYRPDDNVTSILVTCNHITQLLFRILIGILILPMNSPIHRNLRPYQKSHALCLTHHLFIVGIMGQADKIASKLLCPTQ